MSLLKAKAELHRIFDLINEHYFNNEMEDPAITIQTKGKRSAYGWCSTVPFWTDGKEVQKIEINLSAEYLNRPVNEVIQTLWHEMVHYHNIVTGIQDTSRGNNYHNKRFKETCERDNMFYFDLEKPDSKYGWYKPLLTKESLAFLDSIVKPDPDAFKLARLEMSSTASGKKKSNNFKIVCPSCELIIRATKENVRVMCLDCNEEMEYEG